MQNYRQKLPIFHLSKKRYLERFRLFLRKLGDRPKSSVIIWAMLPLVGFSVMPECIARFTQR